MKITRCDSCGKEEIGNGMKITTKGAGPSGGAHAGILLPRDFETLDFCQESCFRNYFWEHPMQPPVKEP